MRSDHKKLLAVLAGLAFNIGFSGAAQATLQGRDLNGSAGSFEAYYDTELGITWLADANYAKTSGHDATGEMNWVDANAWAASLSFTNGTQVFDNWRLPTLTPINGVSFQYLLSSNGSTDEGYNVSAPGSVFAGSKASEMAHLFYNTLGNPSYETLSGANSGLCAGPNYCLKNVGPFSNMKSWIYWTGLEYGKNTSRAWDFIPLDGSQDRDPKTETYYAWAVSDGDIAAVPEAQTYAMLLAGLALLGFVSRRRQQTEA
jgi:hypothetical protein